VSARHDEDYSLNPKGEPMFQITGEQALALIDVLSNHVDGEPVEFDKPSADATLVVSFTLARYEISGGGTIEEI